MTAVAEPTVPPRRRTRSLPPVEAMAGYGLAAPAFLLIVVILLAPAAGVLVIALSDWQFGATTLNIVGLDNFQALFRDAVFQKSFVNTIAYTAVVVPATVGLGLLVALLIHSAPSLSGFYRTAHFLPVMATLAAMAIAWEALLHPTIGLINQILDALALPTANWLRDEGTVLMTLAVIGVWQNFGLAMVLFIAGLTAIPTELYDAADVDGADGWFERHRLVTLPMLGPVTMFVVIVIALRAFEVFDTVAILTQGGPQNASQVMLYTLYVESFEFLRTGYGAAVTVVFLVIVVSLTLLQARVMDRRVHYT